MKAAKKSHWKHYFTNENVVKRIVDEIMREIDRIRDEIRKTEV